MRLEHDTCAQFDSESGHLFQQAVMEYRTVLPDPRDDIRVVHLFHLIRQVNKLPHGDYVEFGTHLGFTLKMIHKFMDQSCRLYSFDTFEGFDARDLPAEAAHGFPHWQPGNFSPTSVEQVGQYLDNPSNLTIIKGWFPETWVGFDNHPWRFVHLDMDLYQPTARALDAVWPDVVPGGVILVHDYGDGGFATRDAVNEFCAAKGIWPVELADHWCSAVIRKGA